MFPSLASSKHLQHRPPALWWPRPSNLTARSFGLRPTPPDIKLKDCNRRDPHGPTYSEALREAASLIHSRRARAAALVAPCSVESTEAYGERFWRDGCLPALDTVLKMVWNRQWHHTVCAQLHVVVRIPQSLDESETKHLTCVRNRETKTEDRKRIWYG